MGCRQSRNNTSKSNIYSPRRGITSAKAQETSKLHFYKYWFVTFDQLVSKRPYINRNKCQNVSQEQQQKIVCHMKIGDTFQLMALLVEYQEIDA